MWNKKKLKTFVDFLNDCLEFEFNINEFNHRLMLQKYIYLAGYFGLNHNYSYNLYIRGPYSSKLAEDYYDLDVDSNKLELDDFDKKGFRNFIKDKSIFWLEATTTILTLYKNYKVLYEEADLKEAILVKTKSLKPYIDDEIINESYKEISEKFMN